MQPFYGIIRGLGKDKGKFVRKIFPIGIQFFSFAEIIKTRCMESTLVAKKKELPPSYHQTFKDIKARIQEARIKASFSVNQELIKLYWDVGQTIVERVCCVSPREPS